MTEKRQPTKYEFDIPQEREFRGDFLKEWSTTVLPFLDATRAAEDAAVSFAQSTIKTGSIINAGGLVAIPVTAALFKVEAHSVMDGLLNTSALFVGGIMLSWLSAYLSYIAMEIRAAARSATYVLHARYARHHYYGDPKPGRDFETRHDRLHRRSFWFSRGAITASVLTFGLFIAGAILGTNTLLQAPHKPDRPNSSTVVHD